MATCQWSRPLLRAQEKRDASLPGGDRIWGMLPASGIARLTLHQWNRHRWGGLQWSSIRRRAVECGGEHRWPGEMRPPRTGPEAGRRGLRCRQVGGVPAARFWRDLRYEWRQRLLRWGVAVAGLENVYGECSSRERAVGLRRALIHAGPMAVGVLAVGHQSDVGLDRESVGDSR